MQAALAIHPAKGRALSNGGLRRALPILAFWALMVSGAVLTAQALYIPVKAQVAQVMLERAFAASVETGTPVKPWSWADTAPLARVSAPRLQISEIVLSGGSGEAMAFGPTAMVDDRVSGITVLAAHRDTHFEFVQHLLVGDDIWLERIDGSTAKYRVTRAAIVRWDEFTYPADGVADGSGGLLALTTCYPFDTNQPGPLRYVIWAKSVSE